MNEKSQIVSMARNLERLMMRRRNLLKRVHQLDVEIRDTKKLLRDLTEPTVEDVYGPATEEWGPALPGEGRYTTEGGDRDERLRTTD